MKVAPALAFLSLVLLTAIDAHAASPAPASVQSVADAQKALDTARANLTKAVQRIEKDPPATPDLEAAHEAVGALKAAIDAGAEFEAKDLEYAKAVLAARKELRTHREYVDQRRAKVHIFNHRRTIDSALAALNERARRVEAKDAGQKDFDEARAAAAALKKAVNEGREFVKQDEKFAAYITELDATLARQEKAIDDRVTKLAVDKQRALLEESRRGLSAALAPLGKNGTDAQFDAADKASTLLSTRLEEGKALESKDQTYRADAERARGDLAQAKKKMDELWSAAGLERLKAEIEPAHKDLIAAGRNVRVKHPSAEQIAEARTAAIVVRKLVEKFQPQATRSQAFGQYVNEVKKTLVEVEVGLQLGVLASAQGDLVQALRNLEKRAPTDGQFEEANTARTILEKTLETVHTREPAMLKPVADARALLRDSQAAMTKRRLEVDIQRQRAKVDEAKKNATALVRQIYQPDTGKERLQEAENAVKAVRTVLDEGAAFIKKDHDYSQYDRDVKERIAEMNERISSRRIQLSAGEGRTQLNDAVATAKAKLETAKQPQATDADLTAATQSVEAVSQAIEARTALEKQDKGYAAQAAKARGDLDKLQEGLEFARQARLLRKRVTEALSAGATAVEAAAASKDLRAQKAHYEKALAQFRTCETTATTMVEENKALAGITVLVNGSSTTPKDVAAQCNERLKSTEPLFTQVVALLAFEDGPKKYFEAGKGLLAQSKKTEALGQFNECISSGVILQHRSPELKDRKFTVAGASMNLAELIKQCANQRKALEPN